MNMTNWFDDFKEKISRTWLSDTKDFCKSPDRLPPRMSSKGFSVAARVVGHEIRDFTKRKYGKDLACLRDNETRNKLLTKLSELQLAITNENTKYNLISLAANHSSNFATSLAGHDDMPSDFKSHSSLHKFIAEYYKNCLEQENVSNGGNIQMKSNFKMTKRNKPPRKNLAFEKKLKYLCRCNEPEVGNGCYFKGCWLHTGIPEMKLDEYLNENLPHFNAGTGNKLNLNVKGDWSKFTESHKCIAYRRKLSNGLFQYRVQATFNDVTADALFKTQLDTEYRKLWDPYILKLDIVEANAESSSELVRWVTRCPYPFDTREYIYLRRYKVDEEKKAMVLYQLATDDSLVQQHSGAQRVEVYESKIVIKPHSKDFNQNGCDFVLTYYDDPKMKFIPTPIVDMAASKGICDSTEHMHEAALNIHVKDSPPEQQR